MNSPHFCFHLLGAEEKCFRRQSSNEHNFVSSNTSTSTSKQIVTILSKMLFQTDPALAYLRAALNLTKQERDNEKYLLSGWRRLCTWISSRRQSKLLWASGYAQWKIVFASLVSSPFAPRGSQKTRQFPSTWLGEAGEKAKRLYWYFTSCTARPFIPMKAQRSPILYEGSGKAISLTMKSQSSPEVLLLPLRFGEASLFGAEDWPESSWDFPLFFDTTGRDSSRSPGSWWSCNRYSIKMENFQTNGL